MLLPTVWWGGGFETSLGIVGQLLLLAVFFLYFLTFFFLLVALVLSLFPPFLVHVILKKAGQAANAIGTTEYIIDISKTYCVHGIPAYAWRLRGSYDDNLLRLTPSSWPSANAVTPHPHASGVSQQQPGLVRCCSLGSAPLLVRKVFRFRCVGRGHRSGRAGHRVACGAEHIPSPTARQSYWGEAHSSGCALTLILAWP